MLHNTINKTKTKIMELEQLIKDLKLNQTVLAAIIGKSQVAFHEKLHKKRGNKFSAEQKEIIKQYLVEMSNKINKLCQ